MPWWQWAILGVIAWGIVIGCVLALLSAASGADAHLPASQPEEESAKIKEVKARLKHGEFRP